MSQKGVDHFKGLFKPLACHGHLHEYGQRDDVGGYDDEVLLGRATTSTRRPGQVDPAFEGGERL